MKVIAFDKKNEVEVKANQLENGKWEIDYGNEKIKTVAASTFKRYFKKVEEVKVEESEVEESEVEEVKEETVQEEVQEEMELNESVNTITKGMFVMVDAEEVEKHSETFGLNFFPYGQVIDIANTLATVLVTDLNEVIEVPVQTDKLTEVTMEQMSAPNIVKVEKVINEFLNPTKQPKKVTPVKTEKHGVEEETKKEKPSQQGVKKGPIKNNIKGLFGKPTKELVESDLEKFDYDLSTYESEHFTLKVYTIPEHEIKAEVFEGKENWRFEFWKKGNEYCIKSVSEVEGEFDMRDGKRKLSKKLEERFGIKVNLTVKNV